jgi:prepilin-type N-terminal cleavage/methylation domain-containing protein
MKFRSTWPHPANRGFTMVELLVALIVATMIMGVASGVFVTAFRSWERGSEVWETLQIARTTSDMIERHLRSAMAPSGDGRVIFYGEDLSEGEDVLGHRLTFASAAPVRFPRDLPLTDASEVEFELDPASGDGLTMRIDSSPDDEPEAGGYRIELSPRVRDFKVLYHDGTDWVKQWDEDALPVAVEFFFTVTAAQDRPDTPATEKAPQPYTVRRLIAMPTASADRAADSTTQQPAGQSTGQPANPQDGPEAAEGVAP